MKEILGETRPDDLPIDHLSNLFRLHYCANYIRRLYDQSILVSSGYRTEKDHRRIYKKKGISDSRIPWGSAHLIGAAIDLYDPEKKLQMWILENLEVSEVLDVYYEMFEDTPNWVHLQIFPPKSRKRFFKP